MKQLLEIKDIFSAESKSISQFLGERGQGLYIPSYQRPYTWGKQELTKLITDTIHGFKLFSESNSESEATATFIGSIIAIHDTTNATVIPANKSGLPNKVMTIIDGQQRLTSLIMLIICLYIKIEKGFISRFSGKDNAINQPEFSEENSHLSWLFKNCIDVMDKLSQCVSEKQSFGVGLFKWYPRMTRSYEDTWHRERAEYTSPIAEYIYKFTEKTINPENSEPLFELKEIEEFEKLINSVKGKPKNNKETFLNGALILKKLINTFYESSSEDSDNSEMDEVPSFDVISKALSSDASLSSLLSDRDVPNKVIELLSDNTKENKEFNSLVRLIIFSYFVLNRISLTVITAKNEEYAFDIFESLNTTGAPLTALETFKPKIISWKGQEKYNGSDAQILFDSVTEYIESLPKKDKNTSEFLISFALAFSGKKLTSRINEQRLYLKGEFDNSPDEIKLDFLTVMADTANFYSTVWKQNTFFKDLENISISKTELDEVKLCLNVLSDLNHTIVLPLLSRYYGRFVHSESDQQKLKDFLDLIKVVTSFFFFWRTSRTTTDSIDAKHRNLMKNGFIDSDRSLVLFNGLAAKCTKENGKNDLPDITTLKLAFKEILNKDGKIKSKEDWIAKASSLPLYSISKQFTRFMLLAAEDKTVIDEKNPYLRRKGKEGLDSYFTSDSWNDELYKTIEHIAPESPVHWAENNIYTENQDLVDSIGNLTLLPMIENAVISNANWETKRLCYKILASKTQETAEELAKDLDDKFKGEVKKIQKASQSTKYLVFAEAISNYEGNWNKDSVKERGERICELAWDKVYSWLE